MALARRANGEAWLGRRNWILHQTGRRHFWQGAGALSIKSFFGGRALYDVGAGRYAVGEGSYLVLNRGREYSITVESPSPVESFCLFFEDGLAEDVARSLALPAGRLLDDPSAKAGPVPFFERTYPHDDVVSPALLRLRTTWAGRKHEPGWITEQLHGVLDRLLRVQRRSRAEAAALCTVRPATREELYRRLHRARDYAAACFGAPLSLDEMARVACLSPNHFLRSFRRLFGRTPHQYLIERRLAEARRLLRDTDAPVTEVCLAVGFESLGSFSRLFRERNGSPPSRYRRKR